MSQHCRYPDAFVGREQEIASIHDALAKTPMLTITGGGGMGKTRLAHEIVSALGRELCIVDGELITSADSLLSLLLQALEMRSEAATAGESFRRLATALRYRSTAILLIDGVAKLARPAAAALESFVGDLGLGRVIVTSRAPLGTRGEQVLRLSGLPEQAAIQLLIDRVERRGRRIHSAETKTLADIVRRLDGIPLAIELFAPHVFMLGADGASTHFRETLPALRAGERALVTTSSMEGALESCWRTLDEHVRQVLSALTVFPRTFDFRAAQALFSTPSGIDVGRALETLFGAGLVERIDNDRFVLLNCVREFAKSRATPVDWARHQRRHADIFAARARLAVDELRRRGVPRDLALDSPNYQAAIDTLRAVEGSIDDIARIHELTETRRFAMSATIECREALEAFQRELEQRGASEFAVLRVQLEIAEAERRAGELARAEEHALSVYRAVASNAAQAHPELLLLSGALRALGAIAFVRGETRHAKEQFERARHAAEACAENRLLALILGDLGSVELVLGQPFEASMLYERSARLAGRTGLTWVRAGALANLGVAAAELGDLARARESLAQSLLADASHAQSIVGAFATGTLGLISHVEGDEHAALDAYDRALELARALGHRGFEGVYTGYIALAKHQSEIAVTTLAELDEAISILKSAGNQRERALFLAAQGTLLRRAERLDAASRRFSEAKELLEDEDRPSRIAIALLSGDSAPVDSRDSLELRLAARFLSRSVNVDCGSIAWTVARDGSWFQASDGPRVDVPGMSLRLLLSYLMSERWRVPGRSIPQSQLIAIAWPGERMSKEAGRNRLKVLVSKLRALGLRTLIKTGPSGYYLATNQSVQSAA